MGSVDRKRQNLTESEDDHTQELSSEGDSPVDDEMSRDSEDAPLSNSEENPEDLKTSEEEIEASLAFFDPSDKDFHSINELFRQQFKDIADLAISELTETIIRQSTVGSVVRCEDSDDDAFVLGVISVLNFDRYKDLKCLKQMTSYISNQCTDATKKQIFDQVMLSSKAGLIINERLLNVPPQVGPPLNQSLFEEIGWAVEDEPTEELRASFKMDEYVMMTCVYQDPQEDPKTGHSSKKSKVLLDAMERLSAMKLFAQVAGPMGYIYAKPEDEFYHKFSKEWFVFPLLDSTRDSEDLKPFRLILLITHESACQARTGRSLQMEGSVLEDKLRKLQSTQETINATADFLIENSADAKRIVKTWNEEFTTSSVNKKLTLLYLANDVLQRCKTNAFLPGFLHYLPKATAHLYKHGDAKIRTAVMRSHLEKVKDTPPVEEVKREDESAQGTKRKRGVHPIQECQEEVEESARQRSDVEQMRAQLIRDRKISELTKEELLRLSAFSDQLCTAVKTEIQVRKKMVDLLRDTLTQQEEGLKDSKEMLRLCFVQQEEIKKASAPAESLLAQESFNGRSSMSVSDENNEVALLPTEISSSTANLSNPSPHSYQPSPLAYPASLLPPYPRAGPISYGSHPPGQPVHALAYPMMHPDGSVEKSQEHEIPNPFHHAPPFMRQGYMPGSQGPPPAPYETRVMHEIRSSYGPQLNYGGYPGQYESDKDWRS